MWACQLPRGMLEWACSVNKFPPAKEVELANNELKLLYKSLVLAHCLHRSISTISWHWPLKEKTDCHKTVVWARQLPKGMLEWACSGNKLPPAEKVELANNELKLLYENLALAYCLHRCILVISWHWPMKKKTDCYKTITWARQLPSRMLEWARSMNKFPPAKEVELANDELELLYENLTLAHCLHHCILAISWHWPIKKKTDCHKTVAWACQLPRGMLKWARSVNKLPPAEEVELANDELKALVPKPYIGPLHKL